MLQYWGAPMSFIIEKLEALIILFPALFSDSMLYFRVRSVWLVISWQLISAIVVFEAHIRITGMVVVVPGIVVVVVVVVVPGVVVVVVVPGVVVVVVVYTVHSLFVHELVRLFHWHW